MLHVAELDRWSSSQRRSSRRVSAASHGHRGRVTSVSTDGDIRALAAAQSQGPAPVAAVPTQLTLDLGDAPRLSATSGLPEMTGPERVRAELEVLGLDASGHVIDFYAPMLDALGVTRARDLLTGRSGREVLVAGVKVATQTPPIRSGRRVVFLTLDDATGPADLTFFEDVQGPYAATVFHSWLLLCRGVVRRTGPRGVSIRATGAWEMSALQEAWTSGGEAGVREALAEADRAAWERAAALGETGEAPLGVGETPEGRRVLVHASGFVQSPYADIKPAGESVRGSRGAGAFVPDAGGAGALGSTGNPGSTEQHGQRRPARGSAAQAVARESRKLGALGWKRTRTNRQGGPRARRAAPPETGRGPALGGRLLRRRPRGRDVGRAPAPPRGARPRWWHRRRRRPARRGRTPRHGRRPQPGRARRTAPPCPRVRHRGPRHRGPG